MKEEFIPSTKSSEGTGLSTYITASYKDLVTVLGKPNAKMNCSKISTSWVFEPRNWTDVITIYDYKETNLYASYLPSVKNLRRRKSITWHIGSHKCTTAYSFKAWLEEKIDKLNTSQNEKD